MTQQNILEIPAVPDGYMANASGHLVPKTLVREHDLLRDEVARRLAARAVAAHQLLVEFKRDALADIADLVKITGERFDVKLGGDKGNVQITTYDGRFKILRSVADRIAFTEEIEAARELINDCIRRWSEGANDNIRVLVDRAFRTDTKGQMKTSAVLELLRLDIQDEQWKQAMAAIRESIQSTGTATYVRVYERNSHGSYEAINLDLAAV